MGFNLLPWKDMPRIGFVGRHPPEQFTLKFFGQFRLTASINKVIPSTEQKV